MGNYIRFILQNLPIILFLILELISINLAINYDNRRKNLFLSTSNKVSGYFQSKLGTATSYFDLKDENNILSRENAELRKELLNFQKPIKTTDPDSSNFPDSYQKLDRYSLISAEIISNSFSSLHNYLTINVGKKQNVEPGMGVMTAQGPVGLVVNTSENYSKVISLYNIETVISAKIKRNSALGVVRWEPYDLRYLTMREIPRHVEIEMGDTVVTSGYSFSFPEGIPIGIVEEFNVESGENDYTVSIRLIGDLYQLQNCIVVNDRWRDGSTGAGNTGTEYENISNTELLEKQEE